MDTRLRKFSRAWYIKLTAYVLILCLTAGFVFAGAMLFGKVSDPSAFESKTYAESTTCSEELARVINNLMVLQYDYISEENVKAGGAVDEYLLYSNITGTPAYNEYLYNIHETYENGQSGGVEVAITPQPNPESEIYKTMQAHPDWEMFQNEDFVRYLTENPHIIDAQRNAMIEEQLRNYTRVMTFLKSVTGKFSFDTYRAETDLAVETAKAEDIKKMPIYATYDIVSESIVVYRDGQAQRSYGPGYYYNYDTRDANDHFRVGVNDRLLVGIEPQYLVMREQEWENDHRMASICIMTMVGTVALALILLIYLCVVTGREPTDNEVHLGWIDRMYSEMHIAILISMGVPIVFIFEVMALDNAVNLWPAIMAGTCAIIGLSIPICLSLIRSIKARRFIRSFATGRLCIRLTRWVLRTLRQLWDGGSLMGRGIALAVLVPILCMPWVTVPFIIAGCVFLVYRAVRRFQLLQRGVREVRMGNLDFKIDIKNGVLGELAEDINTLSEGLETAISSEVRSERLKTELISNVSHDIKTPLTSIVTYVDLLKTELAKATPDLAVIGEYTDVIDRKTARLRVLTTDLFEAAKATSGAMNVELEQVDVQALVRQGLGEFDDKLADARLDVRVNMPEKPQQILADGRLVWRILENMLSNVVKYSLPGSRVYLDVTAAHGMVMLTIKNISAYELNVPAEELMERFKRGDESRSSEGSGLGLSIAMSLAQLQHGIFTIAVDGDLFKASLSMPEYARSVPLEKA